MELSFNLKSPQSIYNEIVMQCGLNEMGYQFAINADGSSYCNLVNFGIGFDVCFFSINTTHPLSIRQLNLLSDLKVYWFFNSKVKVFDKLAHLQREVTMVELNKENKINLLIDQTTQVRGLVIILSERWIEVNFKDKMGLNANFFNQLPLKLNDDCHIEYLNSNFELTIPTKESYNLFFLKVFVYHFFWYIKLNYNQ